MQNKGIVIVTAILLTLASIFYLSCDPSDLKVGYQMMNCLRPHRSAR